MAGILHSSTYLDHLGHFLIIFFKTICYFPNCARGIFGNLRIWVLGRPGMISKWIFLHSCYLQPRYSSNSKSFFGENRKALGNNFYSKSTSVIFFHPVLTSMNLHNLILIKVRRPIFIFRSSRQGEKLFERQKMRKAGDESSKERTSDQVFRKQSTKYYL